MDFLMVVPLVALVKLEMDWWLTETEEEVGGVGVGSVRRVWAPRGLGAESGCRVWGAGSGVPGQVALLRGLLQVPATPSIRQTGSHKRPGDSDCQGAFEEQRSFSVHRIPKLLR